MIIAATDLSEESLKATAWAKAYGARVGEDVAAVYVVENEFQELPGSAPLLSDAGIARKLEKRVRERLEEGVGDAAEIDVILREGRAQTEIDDVSRDASLLVVGSPPDGFSRFSLGSLPQRLCHDPSRPTVVVHPEHPMAEKPLWVVGVDFSSHSQAALDVAVDMGRKVGANLVIVHVVPVPSPSVVSDASIMQIELDSLPLAEARKWAKESLEEFMAEHEAKLDGMLHEAEIVEGYPILSLAEVADRYDADAIVVGTAGRSSIGDRLMGSVAFGLVKRMPTTLILAPS